MNRSFRSVLVSVVLLSNSNLVSGFNIPSKVFTSSYRNCNHGPTCQASLYSFQDAWESFQPGSPARENIAGDGRAAGRHFMDDDEYVGGRPNPQRFRESFDALQPRGYGDRGSSMLGPEWDERRSNTEYDGPAAYVPPSYGRTERVPPEYGRPFRDGDLRTSRNDVMVDDDDVGGRLNPMLEETDLRKEALMGPEWTERRYNSFLPGQTESGQRPRVNERNSYDGARREAVRDFTTRRRNPEADSAGFRSSMDGMLQEKREMGYDQPPRVGQRSSFGSARGNVMPNADDVGGMTRTDFRKEPLMGPEWIDKRAYADNMRKRQVNEAFNSARAKVAGGDLRNVREDFEADDRMSRSIQESSRMEYGQTRRVDQIDSFDRSRGTIMPHADDVGGRMDKENGYSDSSMLGPEWNDRRTNTPALNRQTEIEQTKGVYPRNSLDSARAKVAGNFRTQREKPAVDDRPSRQLVAHADDIAGRWNPTLRDDRRSSMLGPEWNVQRSLKENIPMEYRKTLSAYQKKSFDSAKARVAGVSTSSNENVVADKPDIGGRMNTMLKENGQIEYGQTRYDQMRKVTERNAFDRPNDDDVGGRMNTIYKGRTSSMLGPEWNQRETTRNQIENDQMKNGQRENGQRENGRMEYEQRENNQQEYGNNQLEYSQRENRQAEYSRRENSEYSQIEKSQKDFFPTENRPMENSQRANQGDSFNSGGARSSERENNLTGSMGGLMESGPTWTAGQKNPLKSFTGALKKLL